MTTVGMRLGSMRLRCEVLLWRHGYLWVLLGVALVAALLGQFVLVPHQQAAVLQAQQQLRSVLEAQAQREQGARRPVQVSAEDAALAQLLAVAIAEDDVGEVLRRMAKIAQAHGVLLSKSSFQSSTEGHGGLSQLQVTLPVKASYHQTKGFVEEVLRQLPGVSLDALVLQRDSVAQNQVEVRAKFSLWILPGKAPKARP